jgi:hypothetical protein
MIINFASSWLSGLHIRMENYFFIYQIAFCQPYEHGISYANGFNSCLDARWSPSFSFSTAALRHESISAVLGRASD